LLLPEVLEDLDEVMDAGENRILRSTIKFAIEKEKEETAKEEANRRKQRNRERRRMRIIRGRGGRGVEISHQVYIWIIKKCADALVSWMWRKNA